VGGECVSRSACSAIDLGKTPVEDTLVGQDKPAVVSVKVTTSTRGSLEAVGVVDEGETEGVGNQAIAAARTGSGVAAGVPVTKVLRRQFKPGSKGRITVKLKLNPEGRSRLASAGTLRARIVVRIQPRGSEPVLLNLFRVWRAGNSRRD
jgi:hypothetical protein